MRYTFKNYIDLCRWVDANHTRWFIIEDVNNTIEVVRKY